MAAEVTLVGEIDDYRFVPGELTRTLMQDYRAATGQTVSKAAATAA